MRTVILIGFLSIFALVCFAEDLVTKDSPDNKKQAARTVIENKNLSECEKAGGKPTKITECDGSESVWCVISKKEECYADQVSNGKCAVGEYSEELQGIVGISPRVLCDKQQ